MQLPLYVDYTDAYVAEPTSSSYTRYDDPATLSADRGASRFLVIHDTGIGDAVMIGLGVIEQIVRNEPTAYGKIDVLCNPLQAEVYSCDPRLNLVIQCDRVFYPDRMPSKWLRGFLLDERAASLTRFLRARHYEALFPGTPSVGLFFRLHAHLMRPNLFTFSRELFQTLHGEAHMHLSVIVRQAVNHYFGRSGPEPDADPLEAITLYLDASHLRNARLLAAEITRRAHVSAERSRLLLVGPDTTSVVTRPPTRLLAPALAAALHACPDLVACVLPSYTDRAASRNLLQELRPAFAERVLPLPLRGRSRPHLLDLAALFDQADILLSGDTGVMHLAAAPKRLRPDSTYGDAPRNTNRIITLFGGTNPDLYGYSQRALIIGRGREEQRAYFPGFSKDPYKPKGRDLFDHITPQKVTEAIIALASAKSDLPGA